MWLYAIGMLRWSDGLKNMELGRACASSLGSHVMLKGLNIVAWPTRQFGTGQKHDPLA